MAEANYNEFGLGGQPESPLVTSNLNAEFSMLRQATAVRPEITGGPGSTLANVPKNSLAYFKKKAASQNQFNAARPGLFRQSAQFYHPLFEALNLQLPTKTREINQWCRHFYKTDGYVGTLTDLHSEFPLTGVHIVCDDPKVKRFFEVLFFDVIRGKKLLSDVNLEYWKLGNVFPFLEWDDNKGIWTGYSILNPDFVEVEKSMLVEEPVLKLDPDDNLKRIVSSRQPKELYQKLAQIENGELVNLVARGEKIPLNKFRVSHLAFKLSPYESVGTPLMFRAFKPLIFKDLLRRVQQAVYERHITPLKLIKIGSDTLPATPEAIRSAREAFDELNQDLNAWFVYHHAINVEYVSSAGKIHPMDAENKLVREEIMAAMMGSQAMVGGEGPTYANASVALQILVNRYLRNEEMLADWVKNYIFRPVAIAQEFKRTNEWGEEEYIVPDIEFEFMKMRDDAQQKNLLKELVKLGMVSKQTFYTYLGLNGEREKKMVAKEKSEEAKAAKSAVLPKKKGPEMGGGAMDLGGGGMPGGDLGADIPGVGAPSPGEEMPAGGPPGTAGPSPEAPGTLPETA